MNLLFDIIVADMFNIQIFSVTKEKGFQFLIKIFQNENNSTKTKKTSKSIEQNK